NLINLAHGALYMFGAFIAAAVANASGSFLLGVLVAVPATGLIGAILEMTWLRHFYGRSHLDQVLVTFGLILVSNEVVKL
ncbi:branched-chain amino acid ABC transporter permease, partial [Acinetobacter baumannii]